MLDALQITRLHDEATLRWHQSGPSFEEPPAIESAGQSAKGAWPEGLVQSAMALHRANYDLWHEEDKARAPDASDADIARGKQAIDAMNQRRNDLMEATDRLLLAAAEQQNPQAPLHSESPGLILDRLSILALKVYHTADESCRASASEAHRARNVDRLSLLQEQRTDLAACLDALWTEVRQGKRRFKLYRQLKMYNDPDLNPAVYSRKTETGSQGAGLTFSSSVRIKPEQARSIE
jgi:Protein of unknown function (DUF4254)